jgi:hypothetical protein
MADETSWIEWRVLVPSFVRSLGGRRGLVSFCWVISRPR